MGSRSRSWSNSPLTATREVGRRERGGAENLRVGREWFCDTGPMEYRPTEQLEAGFDTVRDAPRDRGTLELIVRRQAENEREILETGELDLVAGLVGDRWFRRRDEQEADPAPEVDRQLTIMSSRAIALIAGERDRWPLAGDQLFVDFDLSEENLPPGTSLAIGAAVIQVTAPPHTGCAKSHKRFGPDALRFVSSPQARALRLRGANAKVVRAGAVRAGDLVTKL